MITSPTRTTVLLACTTPDGTLVRRTILEEAGYDVFTCSPLGGLLADDTPAFSVAVVVIDRPEFAAELIKTVRKRYKDAGIILVSGYVEELGLTPESAGVDEVIKKDSKERVALLRVVHKLLNARNKRTFMNRRAAVDTDRRRAS
jgi:CheY-like chemotaxis protein